MAETPPVRVFIGAGTFCLIIAQRGWKVDEIWQGKRKTRIRGIISRLENLFHGAFAPALEQRRTGMK